MNSRGTLSYNEVSLVEEILKEKSLAAFSNAQEVRKKEQDYLELEEQIFFLKRHLILHMNILGDHLPQRLKAVYNQHSNIMPAQAVP